MLPARNYGIKRISDRSHFRKENTMNENPDVKELEQEEAAAEAEVQPKAAPKKIEADQSSDADQDNDTDDDGEESEEVNTKENEEDFSLQEEEIPEGETRASYTLKKIIADEGARKDAFRENKDALLSEMKRIIRDGRTE